VSGVTIYKAPDEYKERLWIVTYDIPSSISYRNKRRRFYRRLHRLMRVYGGSGSGWVNMSTIVTRDRELAEHIMRLIDSIRIPDARAAMFEARMECFIGVLNQLSSNSSR